jgi:hypothetical protein
LFPPAVFKRIRLQTASSYKLSKVHANDLNLSELRAAQTRDQTASRSRPDINDIALPHNLPYRRKRRRPFPASNASTRRFCKALQPAAVCICRLTQKFEAKKIPSDYPRVFGTQKNLSARRGFSFLSFGLFALFLYRFFGGSLFFLGRGFFGSGFFFGGSLLFGCFLLGCFGFFPVCFLLFRRSGFLLCRFFFLCGSSFLLLGLFLFGRFRFLLRRFFFFGGSSFQFFRQPSLTAVPVNGLEKLSIGIAHKKNMAFTSSAECFLQFVKSHM